MSHDSPGFVYGEIPSAIEWDAAFTAKQDWSPILDAVIAGGTPWLPLTGGIVSGPIQFGSPRAWAGDSLATNPYISQIVTWTGSNSGTGGTSFNYLQATESVNAGIGAGNGATLLDIQMFSQGVQKLGQSNALNVSMKLNSTSGNTIASGNSGIYTAGRLTAYTTVNDNGTSGTPWGGILGMNVVGALYTGATDYGGVGAVEFDVLAQTGTSTQDKMGLSVVLLATDAVNGTRDDIGLSFNNQYAQGSGAGWTTGISFGRLGGAFPMKSTGTMIGATSGNGTLLAAHGIDFSAVTFSSDFLKSTGFLVDGSGNITTPKVTPAGSANLILGTGTAVATNATSGMILIPTCAGPPTGTVGAAGQATLIWDSTNFHLYVGIAGTWKSVALS